jgi:predicted transcriptional regulator
MAPSKRAEQPLKEIHSIILFLTTICHPIRTPILLALLDKEEPLTVNEIHKRIISSRIKSTSLKKLYPLRISQELRKLTNIGIVTKIRGPGRKYSYLLSKENKKFILYYLREIMKWFYEK